MNYKNGTYLSAIESAMKSFDDLRRIQESIMNPVDEFNRTQAAIESAMKPVLDWQKQVGLIEATQVRLEFPNIIRGELAVDPFRISTPTQRLTSHEKVFIVHGHDHSSRDAVADFVDNWGLIPIVLDEQPSGSRTIIEKFEHCADEANFVIVLMTPDDVGASVKSKTNLKPRARQNVIFELGYFFGSKGRKRVCILYKEGVELPSDIHGVVYVPMDDEGKWQKRVIREMMDSDILIKKNKV